MLHHVSLGVSDVERAARFYDAVLAALGYKRVMEFMPYAVAYGESAPELWVGTPHNQLAPTVGNGVHIALAAKNKDAVHAFHQAALDAGGVDDGAPGPRPEYSASYYGAFVRDPDGNKLEAMVVAIVKPAAKPKAKPAKKKAAARGGARKGARKPAGRRSARSRSRRR